MDEFHDCFPLEIFQVCFIEFVFLFDKVFSIFKVQLCQAFLQFLSFCHLFLARRLWNHKFLFVFHVALVKGETSFGLSVGDRRWRLVPLLFVESNQFLFLSLDSKGRRDLLAEFVVEELFSQSFCSFDVLIGNPSCTCGKVVDDPLVGSLYCLKEEALANDAALSAIARLHLLNYFKLAFTSAIQLFQVGCCRMKSLGLAPKEGKHWLGVDLGNDWVRVFWEGREWVHQNNLFIENGNVYLSNKCKPSCLTNTVFMLGQKFEDPTFQHHIKYYNLGFKRGANKNILVQSQYPALGQDFYLDLLLLLLLRAVFHTNTLLKFILDSPAPNRLVCTVFEGKLNPYRHSLSQCLAFNGIKNTKFVSTNVCVASHYLRRSKKGVDDSEVMGIIDFGAQGVTFSICKLYGTDPQIVEVLSHQFSECGGIKLTSLLVDYVVSHLIQEKGMNISTNKLLMSKLKLLCNQAKHMLSSHEKAFIRLDGLPDIIVFGMEVSVQQFEKQILKEVQSSVGLIARSIQQSPQKVTKVIMGGGSSQIPLFRSLVKQQLEAMPVIDCDPTAIKQGLIYLQDSSIKVLDIYPFDLKMEGDDKTFAHLVRKGECLPLRKKCSLTFPSGELTFSLKFYQNEHLVATGFIPERPRQNKFTLFLQIDHNKMVNIFGTTSQGLIKMSCNMIQIPREQYIRYDSVLQKLDFHLEQD